MTLLLVSVKDPEEAMLAAEAGADLIDLKDPEVGALGALNDETSIAILNKIKPYETVKASATVGDAHSSIDELLDLVEHKAKLKVDFVKLPYSQYLFTDAFVHKAMGLKKKFDVEFIVVMDANKPVDWHGLSKLNQTGFYGCMLDTSDKKNHLLASIEVESIVRFVNVCKQLKLFIGLAGSLQASMVDSLLKYQPDYLGFRSGVCVENARKNRLLPGSVKVIKRMLYNHNDFKAL